MRDDPVPSGQAPNAAFWLAHLPLRWSRNAAGAAMVLIVAAIVQPFSTVPIGRQAALGAALVVLTAALAGYVIGYWARWSLQTRFAGDARGMADAIISTWINGAIILTGVPVIVVDGAMAMGLSSHEVGLQNWIVSLPVSIGIALIVGAISRAGLRRAAAHA